MADFEPPSFSLGLDLDFDFEPRIILREDHPREQAGQSSGTASLVTIEEDDGNFESPATAAGPQVPDPPRTLKRLRRGSTTGPCKRESVELWRDVDDEIEEFSSREDWRKGDEPPSTHYHSVCSSSKFPLHGHGVSTTKSGGQRKAEKKKQATEAPVSANLETSSNKLMFPKLIVSPLRRFQLIDSDSDDPSGNEAGNIKAYRVDLSSKEGQPNPGLNANSSEQKRTKAFVNTTQADDLWKDFSVEKSFQVPTPALDDFCEEYFRSTKDKNETGNLRSNECANEDKGCYQDSNLSKNDELPDLGHPLPPAYRYFFHDDPRIQQLVRSCLPNFFPLGAVNRGYKQPSASAIDYMCQFSDGEGSNKQTTGKNKAKISSTKSRKNSRKSNAKEASQGSGSWVNPKCSAGIPKNAGNRRVHAVVQSAGHWYTAPDGRKVYVTKNGQELIGQIAYRHYRKESRASSKKSKKKSAAK